MMIFMTPRRRGGRRKGKGDAPPESKANVHLSSRRSLALFRDASEVTKWPFKSVRERAAKIFSFVTHRMSGKKRVHTAAAACQ